MRSQNEYLSIKSIIHLQPTMPQVFLTFGIESINNGEMKTMLFTILSFSLVICKQTVPIIEFRNQMIVYCASMRLN